MTHFPYCCSSFPGDRAGMCLIRSRGGGQRCYTHTIDGLGCGTHIQPWPEGRVRQWGFLGGVPNLGWRWGGMGGPPCPVNRIIDSCEKITYSHTKFMVGSNSYNICLMFLFRHSMKDVLLRGFFTDDCNRLLCIFV